MKPASWSRGNAFVFRAGGVRYKSWVGQIGHNVAYGLPLMRPGVPKPGGAGGIYPPIV